MTDRALRSRALDALLPAACSGLICQEETYCGDGAGQWPKRVKGEERGEKREKKDEGGGELR